MTEPQGAALFPVFGAASGVAGPFGGGGGNGSTVPTTGTAGDLFPDWASVLRGSGFPGSGTGTAPGTGVTMAGMATGWSAGGGGSSGMVSPASGSKTLPSGAGWQSQVALAANANGVPPAILSALIQEESGGNPGARSAAGAMGLTQLMPATAAALGVDHPYDPVQNLWAGAEYLGSMLRRFGSIPLALAAYNAGPGAVSQWGGIPPYPQTEAYVRNILALSGSGSVSPPGSFVGDTALAQGGTAAGQAVTVTTAVASASMFPSRMADGP